ncbi:MAG: hypothetical protein AAF560_21710 [Acidobacteriota bacterium]
MYKKSTWFLALVVLLAAGTAFFQVEETEARGGALRFVGSWDSLSVTQDNENISNLLTINIDGTAIFTSPTSFQSTSHGAWKRVGPRRINSTTFGYIYNDAGFLTAVQKVKTDVTVSRDGQSFSGDFSSEISLLDGTVVESESGTTSGQRIVVEAF